MQETSQTMDPSVSKLIAGVAGAFVSLRFVQGSLLERGTMASGGAVMSYYATTPVHAWLGMVNGEGLVGFLIGLFGMAIISKVYEAIHALDAPKMAADTWDAIRKRLGGGKE